MVVCATIHSILLTFQQMSMISAFEALGVLFVFTASVRAAPVQSEPRHLKARSLLDSSFGVPGNQTYDYIIVGEGTGGLAIVTKLVEQKVGSVTVIEADGFYEIDNSNHT